MGLATAIAPREERVKVRDGLHLFIRSWVPDTAPRAVVGIVHGVKSHSGYYHWAAQQLLAKGFAVYAVDLHGRGRSEGERFYLAQMADYVDDAHTLVRLAKGRHPALPFFLLGHSAGGVVSSVYTLEHQDELAGFICESFAFQVFAPDIALSVVKGLSHLVPHVHVLNLKTEDFSRDPAAIQAMLDDPLIKDESQPTNTVAELTRADDRLKREFPQITLPLLILHGTADKVTRPSGSQFFYDTAGSSDKTLKFYDDHAHDLLNDLGREGVMQDIVTWLEARLPAA
ncbi:hydrolase [Luteitalea sp. TBR-22]|uniref:alpha/beta hydrolase n=1 Tax=Luteitalea sp. TBR-22 TaxID=2802971 RepID=UPI001AF9D1DE|nr:alpha/beta hydrolase [Luteitalea sp. TBR-22]BCS31698.1 hydrolase [Luteitalea sp. TBR-22]